MLDWSHIMNSPDHADAAIQALRDSGMRAIFAHGTPSDPPSEWYYESTRRHPEDVRRLRAEQFSSNDGLVTLMMAIRGPDFSTMETTIHDLQLARELDLRVTMHIGGGLRGRKARSIGRMHEAGVLGPDMTFVHCNCCADHELRLMAETGGLAGAHDHPFEETYMILEGEVDAWFDGEHYRLKPGDVAFAAVGCIHEFSNPANAPVRWLETQAPQPPSRYSYRFARDWTYLEDVLHEEEHTHDH